MRWKPHVRFGGRTGETHQPKGRQGAPVRPLRTVTRYMWVAARKAEGFPITMACKVADVSRQAFHDWRAARAAGPTEVEVAEAALVEVMREIHDEHDGTYGVPRMTVELANRGQRVNHKRVERLMRAHGIVGVHKPAKVRTTIPAEDNPPTTDLVGRGFSPGAPDIVWCGDITYIPTDEGWLYLASVLDLGSRRLLGYSMAAHMRTELVADALTMAAGERGGITAGIVFHGDRGSQYMSHDYRDQVTGLGMRQSVGRTGVCLGQRRRRVVLVIAQARGGSSLPVRHPCRGTSGDLRLDQPLQPPPAPLEPRLRPTRRVGDHLRSDPGRPGRVTNVTGQRGEPQR